MQNTTKRNIAWDFGISDLIEEIPPTPSPEEMKKVVPFVQRGSRIYMIRPEPSWESD